MEPHFEALTKVEILNEYVIKLWDFIMLINSPIFIQSIII